MNNHAGHYFSSESRKVTLKWSEVLESAFDYYYLDYIPAWTLSETRFNNVGSKIYIRKDTGAWVNWEKIESSERPDIATLFDLLPDLPHDKNFWLMMKDLRSRGIKEAQDHFWENIFSYKSVKKIEKKGRTYRIEWEA